MKFWLLMLLIGRLGHVNCDPDWRLPQMATPLHYQLTLLPLLCFSRVTGRDPSDNRTVLEYFNLSDQLELLPLFSPFGLAAGQRFRIGLLFRAKIYQGSAQAFHRMSYTDDKDCCKK